MIGWVERSSVKVMASGRGSRPTAQPRVWLARLILQYIHDCYWILVSTLPHIYQTTYIKLLSTSKYSATVFKC